MPWHDRTEGPIATSASIQRSMPRTLLLFMMVLLIAGCRKEHDPPQPDPTPATPSPVHTLRMDHHVDGQPLIFDSLMYMNDAGHAYSITRLEYYISDLHLIGASSHSVDGPYYVNARNGTTVELSALPIGVHDSASLLLGLPPGLNTTGGLPVTMENNAMAWPEPMGGGYHFIKLEGHFMNGNNSSGYAMHIGMDEFLAHCVMPDPIDIDAPPGELVLRFNINEIFRTPHNYDLSTGNYSMGSMMLMGQLRDNLTDAFTLTYEP